MKEPFKLFIILGICFFLSSCESKPSSTESETSAEVTSSNNTAVNTVTKRTQAEISIKTNGKWEDRKYIGGDFKNVSVLDVPTEHTDHSHFIRYEGPGWESDKIGYRFYLDWRNAVDIFGKKTPEMVLQNVGLDGFDSYHEPADWGMDILKVGSSLGIGSIGFWNKGKATRIEKTSSLKCEILENGNLQSKIRTHYNDWEVDNKKTTLISDLTIQAGSRMTRQDIDLSEALPNICTGIVKHEKGALIKKIPTNKNDWGYIATFGVQSLAEDHLGMGLFFSGENLLELQEDKDSHVVVLNPINKKLSYYFAATWEQDEDGIKTMEAFKKYLDAELNKLNSE